MNAEDIPLGELKKAVALKYDGQSAPVLMAKGSDELAEEIIKLAKQNDVPLCDNSALVNLLCQLELGDSIPKDLYISVAYILAFAYEMTYLRTADMPIT